MKVARLDAQGRWLADCAPGETGHLLINGPNVFAGYADAAQTAAAFAAPGWLRTPATWATATWTAISGSRVTPRT